MASNEIYLDFADQEAVQEDRTVPLFGIEMFKVLIGGSGGTTSALSYKGQWTAGTIYSVNDLVLHRGYTWRITTAHTSSGSRIDTTKAQKITAQGASLPAIGSLKIAGHSYLDPVGISIPTKDSTASRIQSVFGVFDSRVQNVAISGGDVRHHSGSCTYATVLQNVNPGPQGFPRKADAGVVYTHWGTNDAIQGTTAGNWIEFTFKEAYKAVISRYRAGSVYEEDDPSISYTGTWSTVLYSSEDAPSGSGTSYKRTNTASSSAFITTPTDMGLYQSGVWVALGLIGEDSGASASVYLDGVKHGDVNVGRGTSFGTNFGTGWPNWRTGIVYRLWVPTVVDPANADKVLPHSIELRFGASSNSGYLKFDYWQIESPNPPLVLVSSMVQPPNPQGIWASLATPAVHDTYNGWIQSVVSYFNDPTVRYVDSDTPMGGTTATWSLRSNAKYFSTDGLHPNTEGAKVLAEAAMEEAIAGLTEGVNVRNLAGRWANESDPLYAPPAWSVGSGTPLSTNDDFNRTASSTAIGGSGWTPRVGAWGIDGSGQAYIVRNKFGNPTFTDGFDRPDSTSSPGNGWTALSGTWGLNSNRLYVVTNGSSNKNLLVRDIGSVNHWVEVNPYSATSGIADLGVVLRCQDANNFLCLTVNTLFGGWNLWKCVAGTITNVASAFETIGAPNYGVHAEVGSDNIVRIYHPYNDVTGTPSYTYGDRSSTTYTITDSVLQASNASATKVGVGTPNGATTTASKVDNFAAGNAVSPNIASYGAKWNLITKDFGTPSTTIGTKIGNGGTGNFQDFAGLVMRYQDPDNFYALYASVSFGGWIFAKVVAGTATTLQSYNAPKNTPGNVLAVKMNGTSFTFYVNGVQFGTTTDSTFATGNHHGLLFKVLDEKPVTARWDDFRQGSVPLVGAYGEMYVDNQSDLSAVTLYGPADKSGTFPTGIRLNPTTIDGGTPSARNYLITPRKGTAAAWTSANPTLASGEVGVETDTGKQKVGNGSTAWTSLAYT